MRFFFSRFKHVRIQQIKYRYHHFIHDLKPMKRKNQYIYRNIVERQKKHMNDDKIIELMNKEVNIIID